MPHILTVGDPFHPDHHLQCDRRCSAMSAQEKHEIRPTPFRPDAVSEDIRQQRLQHVMSAIRELHDTLLKEGKPGLYETMEIHGSLIECTIERIRGPQIKHRIEKILRRFGMQQEWCYGGPFHWSTTDQLRAERSESRRRSW